MSAPANKCPKHPDSPIACGGKEVGECWTCCGRPPHWTCNVCQKPIGQDAVHFRDLPPASLTGAEAEARARLTRAIESLQNGAGTWDVVERATLEYARAVRSAWSEVNAQRSRN